MVDLTLVRSARPVGIDPSRETVQRVVTTAWVALIVIDRLSFPSMSATVLGAGSLFLAIFALARPSVRWTVAALVADEALLLSFSPELGNHIMLRMVVNLFMLVWLLPIRWSAMVSLRAMVVALYSVAFVHKLNTSFLDPVVSCATLISEVTLAQFGIDHSSRIVGTTGIVLTLLFEGGLPLLLLFSRTRFAALALGTIFHTGLAVVPIGGVASFSGFMFVAYFGFGSPSLLSELNTLLEWIRDQVARLNSAIFTFIVAVAVAVFTGVASVSPGAPGLVVLPTTFLVGCGMVVLLWRHRDDRRVVHLSERSTGELVGAALMLAFIVGSSLLPFMGGRTHASFSMFSNLRTEIEANHLFIDLPHVLGYQHDLVVIESVSVRMPGLSPGEGLVTPGYELGRLLAEVDEEGTISFTDADGLHELDFETARARFGEPSWIDTLFYRMRSTEPSGPVECRH